MPIYEYECKACGHRLEAMQKISEDPLVSCPECQQDQLSKLVSAAGFQLKGSGWYKTDYASSKDKKDNKSTKTITSTASETKDKSGSSSSSSGTDH